MCFTHKNFAQVLDKYQYNFNIGDIIAGTIFSKEIEGYLVDIGAKNAAYLPCQELYLQPETNNLLVINQTIEFFILAYSIESRQLILSLRRLNYIRAWDRIKQLKLENITMEAIITGSNKGGLLIEVENIKGFIPNSHLSYIIKKDNLSSKSIICKFLIADEQSNQLIMSNRCAQLEQIIDKLKIGQNIYASVAEVKRFGIFFNVYSVPALLHTSEMTRTYATDLPRYFPIGSNWSIKIIHIDPKQGRLSVSVRT